MAVRAVTWTAGPQRVKTVTDYTAGNEDVITLVTGYPVVEIYNDDASATLTVSVDRGPNNETVIHPTANADGCFLVGPKAVQAIGDDEFQAPASVVRVFSAGTVSRYVVTGRNPQGN